MAPNCRLCGSVGEGLRNGTVASDHLSVWAKAVPQLPIEATHFSSSLYAAAASHAAILVLELREVSLSKSVCGYFKGNFLGLQNLLPPILPHYFLQPEVMGTYLPGTGTLD